jgi:hypothetical protein
MKPLRSRAVEQRTLSSPLRMALLAAVIQRAVPSFQQFRILVRIGRRSSSTG